MKTVFVGLSGGVDSAVSAYLLKRKGYKVVGAFIKVWEPDFLPCSSAEDQLSAMRVAAHLGIPFVTYDLEKEYKHGVVDYFIEEYKAGRTPNPDVVCNREIKFGAFWERAQKDGADFIATGHYVNREQEAGGRGRWKLLRGTDVAKDQSYFLWMLTQDDLTHSMFPIGHLEKGEVRRIAARTGLPNAAKKDSQGLCFLGHVDMKEFLQHYIPVKRGPIYDENGTQIGKHDGVAFYTLGQHVPLATGARLYVVAKDAGKNTLVVSETPLPRGAATRYRLESMSWIRKAPEEGKPYEAHIRYRGERHPAMLDVRHHASPEGGASILFDEPVLAAAGQSLVVYDPKTEECMGGGIIVGDADH